ncbi:insulinase family protein [Gallaecimonas sp. GXIMD4217]|uniref:insulinase family protein n=1 Tax=Gallaecimonas sp. GXIMD4217 TaxID=3131927 RepID=UPI00311B0FF2
MKLKATSLAVLAAFSLLGCQQLPSTPAGAELAIQVSPADQRQYRYLELDNGLKVMLASDAQADKAAASLVVHVGHTADPKDRQGLAHFLEHMLFLSTEKYPKVDEYREFIEKHGGGSNAGTGQAYTSYFFDIEPGQFAPALDRFAQFFIAPSLDPAYVEREKKAVHSEYEMKKKDEWRRYNEILKKTANPEHPASQFSVGNLTTLADRDGDRVWDDLKAFHEQYYHAGNMTLALVGREDLDTLAKYAKEMFGAIPGKADNHPVPKVAPFTPEQLGVRIDQEPLKEERLLSLQFPLPKANQHYQAKPLGYVSKLLANTAPGSLYSGLKEAGLVDELSVYHWGPDDHDVLYVDFNLTEAGAGQIDAITEATFAYIDLIRRQGVRQSYFEEQRKAAGLDFRFQEKQRAASLASNLAGNLQEVAPEHVLSAGYLYEQFKPTLIQDYLARLTPANLRQVVKMPGVETDQVEARYQAPYKVSALDDSLKAKWAAARGEERFQLPPANPYLAENPVLKPLAEPKAEPQLLVQAPGLSLWHLQDSDFPMPKASLKVGLYRPIQDVTENAMNSLYADLVNVALEGEGYPASQAGLYFRVGAHDRGLGYTVTGYDEKQRLLVSRIHQALALAELTEARFEQYRDSLVRQWRNSAFERPYLQAFRVFGHTLSANSHGAMAKADALEGVDFASFRSFVNNYRRQLAVEALVHGNLTEQEARDFAGYLKADLLKGAEAIDKPRERLADIPNGQELIKAIDIDHNDAVIAMQYIADGTDVASTARYALTGHMLSAPFFSQLRTEQQLGYVVSAGATSVSRHPALYTVIQSPVADPVTLRGRIDAFLDGYRQTLAQMSDADFAAQKAGLVNKLMEKDKQLAQKSGRLWDLISDERPFDWRAQLIQAVEGLDKAELVDFYSRQVADMGAGRYVVWSEGQQRIAAGTEPRACKGQACFEDIWTFKAQ